MIGYPMSLWDWIKMFWYVWRHPEDYKPKPLGPSPERVAVDRCPTCGGIRVLK